MGQMGWKNFCRRVTVFVAAMFFLAVPLTTPNPDVWSATAQGSASAPVEKQPSLPGDPETEESPASSGMSFVEDLLHDHEDIRTFGIVPEIHAIIQVIGFALDRPAAVHRPPWA